MTEDTGWSNVSFTPEGKARVDFGDVSVTFPGGAKFSSGDGSHPRITPTDDAILTFHIRIESCNISAIPRFQKQENGHLQGTWSKNGLTYSAINATVYLTEPGVLVLESDSLDGVTSPISFVRP